MKINHRLFVATLTLSCTLMAFTAAKLSADMGAGILFNYQIQNSYAFPATAVSVGDEGGQVLGVMEYQIKLFSEMNPTGDALWTDASYPALTNPSVASSKHSNEHYALIQNPYGNGMRAKLLKYTSNTATPVWSFNHPASINAPGSFEKVMISDDGQKIVTAVYASAEGKLYITVFGPNSATYLSQTALTVSGNTFGLDLSANGTKLLVRTVTSFQVFDIQTTTIVANYLLNNGAVQCQAISGNGNVIALGTFNRMDIWQANGSGGYAPTTPYNIPGQAVCGQADLSADGSTLAYAFNLWDYNTDVLVEAMNVSNHAITMSQTVHGSGSLQNIASALEISSDGTRFLVGLWGDEGGLAAEMRYYAKNQNTPLYQYNFPGSVYAAALGRNGKVATANKGCHANQYAGGGGVTFFRSETTDFMASGAPRLGSTVTFTASGTPGQVAKLLVSPNPAATPLILPGTGTLYLDRTAVTVLSMGTYNAQGIATAQFPIGTTPSLVGTDVYFQGATFTTNGRHLSNDWVKLTILPN